MAQQWVQPSGPTQQQYWGRGREPLQWTETANKAFDDLKLARQNTPALGLPNYEKLFHLFVHKKGGFAQAQDHCGKQRPIAYISTKLDPVASASGMPESCCCNILCCYTSRNKHFKSPNGSKQNQDLTYRIPH
uniref:Reverse transcriptase/retrotransposon-derived protein RNase H-like domain-containing protein n=1 Tax=Callorhinchus milii TaxID=7868 RepID=A0A4W3IP18_CALMI